MPEATLTEVAFAVADRVEPDALVVAFTGAGLSRASGVPTFRGEGGVWDRYRPEEVASLEVLEHDPETFWRFYDHLRQVIACAVPNPGHLVLADMEEELAGEAEFMVVTQNIDRFHEQAGNSRVLKLHGDAHVYYCMTCGAEPEHVPLPAPTYPPRCLECGGVVRPDVALFGEALALHVLDAAREACIVADVLLVVGTSGVVEPAASLPYLSLAGGALVVEINPTATALTGVAHYSIQAPATTALPALWERIQGKLAERYG